jgi:hypothetical protein
MGGEAQCSRPQPARLPNLPTKNRSLTGERFSISTLNPQLIRNDFHTTPERHMMPNGLRCGLWIRVIPRRVRVLLPIDQHCVIARLALPRAVGAGGTRLQKCPVYRFFRKINISFDCFDLVALRDGLSIPNRLCHVPPSNLFSQMKRLDVPREFRDEVHLPQIRAACPTFISQTYRKWEVPTAIPSKPHRRSPPDTLAPQTNFRETAEIRLSSPPEIEQR